MAEFVHLTGTEAVERAARNISSAADSMRQTLAHLEDALLRQRNFMDEWLARFEAALESDRTERFALATLKVSRLDQVTIGSWVEQLRPIYSTREALLWLYSPHRLLNGETPADCIVAGNEDQVLAVIEQLKTGAYV